MIDDPITAAVRKARRDILESHGGDIRAYHADVMKRQKELGDRLVSLSPKKRTPTPAASTNTKPG